MFHVRRMSRHSMLSGLLAAILAQPALAEDPTSPDVAPTKDGEIIYSRDVNHSIGAPYFAGTSHAAITAPTRLITDSIALGLAPLTDSETSHITASLPLNIANGALADLQPMTAGSSLAQSNPLLVSENTGLASGGAINRAMGALSNALGSLSVLDGGRP